MSPSPSPASSYAADVHLGGHIPRQPLRQLHQLVQGQRIAHHHPGPAGYAAGHQGLHQRSSLDPNAAQVRGDVLHLHGGPVHQRRAGIQRGGQRHRFLQQRQLAGFRGELDGTYRNEDRLYSLHALHGADDLHRRQAEHLHGEVTGHQKHHMAVFIPGVHVVDLAPRPTEHSRLDAGDVQHVVQRGLGRQGAKGALLPLPVDRLAGDAALQDHPVRLHVHLADKKPRVRQQRLDGVPARAGHQRFCPHQHLRPPGADQLFRLKGLYLRLKRHKKTPPVRNQSSDDMRRRG